MRLFLAYWLIGCVVFGLSSALHEDRCPNDAYPGGVELAASVSVWPAAVVWAIKNDTLPQCKRQVVR